MILLICVICGWIENRWLLLRDAVDGSHAPDQRLAVDRNHSTSAKKVLENLHGASVIRVTEHREKHDVVCDVEVSVTGRQAIEVSSAGARAADDTGHRQGDDLKGTAVSTRHRSQPCQILLQDFIVGILRIVFQGAHDHVWSNEAGNIVDMPVSVVADNSFTQP